MEKRREEKLKKKKTFKSERTIPTFLVGQIIQELKKAGGLAIDQLKKIIQQATHVLKNQPNMLKLISPVTVVGDIHGQYYDLLNIFKLFGKPQQTNYLFLGDYVDRGKFCIQVITLVMVLKINLPHKVHLLRGNHEGRTMTTFFNFKLQCEKKYNKQIYELFVDFFKNLPVCALIDNKYFAVHGGISPSIKMLAQIEKLNRFVEIPESGALCDFLWSDPIDQSNQTWVSNKMRSCSFFYSRNQSSKFLKNNHIKLIIRGHEVQMKGFKYQYQATNDPLTLTIFSAPKYCDTYKNKGAVACVNTKSIEIKTFKDVSHPFVFNNYLNSFQLSFPIIAMSVNKIFNYILKNKKIKQTIQSDDIEMKTIYDKIESENKISQILRLNNDQITQLLSLANITFQQENTFGKELQSETLDNFLEFDKIKEEDSINEQLPTIFGPKRVSFVRIRGKKEEEDDFEQEELIQLQ